MPGNRCMAFELINMVLTSNKGLFETGSFAEIVRFRICPLVTTTLLEEWHQGEEEESSQSNFNLLVKLLQLSSTLLLTYGSTNLRGGECHILITTLLHFVGCSTVGYGNKENEDGFEFGHDANREWAKNARERNGSVEGDSNHHNNPPLPPSNEDAHHHQQQQNQHRQMRRDSDTAEKPLPSAYIWRTSLALEILYSLASQPTLVQSLHTSLDSSISPTTRPAATILFQMTQSLKEYATKGLRGEHRIRAVVEAGWRWTGVIDGEGLVSGGGKVYEPNIFHSANNHHNHQGNNAANQVRSKEERSNGL